MGESEVNVDGEKTKEKGCPSPATGGTCELIGKEMEGAAVDSPAKTKATAQAMACDAMVVVADAG